MNSGENKLHSKRECGPKCVTSDFGVRLSENIAFTWNATQQLLPSAAEECKMSERSDIQTCEIWGLFVRIQVDWDVILCYCQEPLVWWHGHVAVDLNRQYQTAVVVLCFYPLRCRLVTKCTQAWSFLQQFLMVQSNSVTFVLDTQLSLCSQYIVFQYAIFSFQIWLDFFF